MEDRIKGIRRIILIFVTLSMSCILQCEVVYGQPETAEGEIEGRPAPVIRRICNDGSNADSLCNDDSACPSSTCLDRNVFNITVGILFDADSVTIELIKNMIEKGSEVLFDVTDGQAEIGEVTIYNNTFGTRPYTDVIIYDYPPRTWWQADVGKWKVGGSIHVSKDRLEIANLTGTDGSYFAHEFIHLVFDALDEYGRWDNCGASAGGFRRASCPAGNGFFGCLMYKANLGGELCWSENHETLNSTQQSQCRGRSCWEQIVYAWPNTFIAPVGTPDPVANGRTVAPTQFVEPDTVTRIVLVLDESNSMGLESPTRMEQLKIAANDFVTIAENDTELGIVSYSFNAEPTDGHLSIPISSLGTDRSLWIDAINGLTHNTSNNTGTNIGDGLQKAIDMIFDAGGVTVNTAIVLMTDGLNNTPGPPDAAQEDLRDKLVTLLNERIPVYVTCTGDTSGLSSQCAEIANQSGGFYVASATPESLSESFIDIHERIIGRNAINSFYSWRQEPDSIFFVEENSKSVTFTLIWQDNNPNINTTMIIRDPNGNTFPSIKIPKGRYVRVDKPISGEWKMNITWSGDPPERFVKRGYIQNRRNSLTAGIRYPIVNSGEEIFIYAYPRSFGGAITDSLKKIQARVIFQDRTVGFIELSDEGRSITEGIDDIRNDGIFTGVYRNTNQEGTYEFLLSAEIDKWQLAHFDPDSIEDYTEILSPFFIREANVSVAVGKSILGNPNIRVPKPDDPTPKPDKKTYPWWYAIILLLIGSIIFYLFRYLNPNK